MRYPSHACGCLSAKSPALGKQLETFLAEPLAHGAPPYPRYVEREFRRLLSCGVPAHGFYRVRCPDCGYERLLGLS